MKSLLPVIAGEKALEAVGNLFSDISHRKSLELENRHMQREQYARAGVCALEIANTVIRGMNFRSDMRQMRKNICETQRQIRKDAQEIRRCLTDLREILSEEERFLMLQTYCDLFRKQEV